MKTMKSMNSKTTASAVTLLLSTLLGINNASAVILVANPSFEDVQIGSPFYSTNVADVPGWTRTGSSGDAALWHVGYIDGGGSIAVAGDGNQFTTLGGGANGGQFGETHWSQAISGFVSGQDYALNFMMASEHGTIIPGYAVPQTITVSLLTGSDTAARSFTANAPDGPNYWRDWLSYSMKFHATDSIVTVDFGANTPYDVGLDKVEISAVPAPAAVWLFGSGLGVLLAFKRRYAEIA